MDMLQRQNDFFRIRLHIHNHDFDHLADRDKFGRMLNELQRQIR